jgi:hypothetical protein
MTFDIDTVQGRDGWSMRSRKRSHAGPDCVVPIVRCGILAREFCRHGADAEIAAVFERSLYLRSADMFVCVGEPSIGNGPLTLIADLGGSRKLSDLNLRRGRRAIISEQRITIGDTVELPFDDCEVWRPPRWPLPLLPDRLNEVYRAIARLTVAEAPEEGLARLSCLHEQDTNETPFTRIARPRVTRFQSWLRAALDTDQMPAAASPELVQALMGLGPGLTPSGDDVLAGALALLDALMERRGHAALARAITDAPRGLTSPLSDCLLRAAAAGLVGETLCRAVSAIISGAPETAVATIRNIGHSSGWDMLAGIATALEVVVCVRRIGGRKALDPQGPIREAFASV